jgi:23S rRNA (cytosine1962-C5)-methyltransferase
MEKETRSIRQHGCVVTLSKGAEDSVLDGASRIMNKSIHAIEGEIRSGSVVSVKAYDGRFLGYGFLNTSSKIFIRMLTNEEDVTIDASFFEKRIIKADQTRTALGFGDAYRVVFGEADNLPGLTVDKYGDILVLQIVSLGFDLLKDMIVDILVRHFNPTGIYHRADIHARAQEGLDDTSSVLFGTVPDMVRCRIGEIEMDIDVRGGQKTGTFLDQSRNQMALKPYVKGRSVLDCFSHIGGFGLHAALYGAKDVTCLDISGQAVESIRHHASLNGLNQVSAVKANVFDALRTYRSEDRTYDVIILDPPAFAKKKSDLENALRGYKDINMNALRIIRDGGILVTCSCSSHVTLPLFLDMIADAAKDAQKKVRVLDVRVQSHDHAPLLVSTGSLYLKCAYLLVG